jgi:tetratricopeptide (TPR) repeat protein
MSPDEQAVRAAVQQYFDALAARDPDRAASSWSAGANPRMTRDTFVALFGPPAEDVYTIEIRSVAINGGEARVRVSAVRTRLETRGGQPFTSRLSVLNSETWRKEAADWKLLRDAPFADELADQYLAAPEADRAKVIERLSTADRAALRYAVSQRATMAVTLGKDYAGGRALFERALEISRAIGDRVGEANSLHNIAQADYILHEFPAATEAYGKELAVAREASDDSLAAGALYGLGTIAYASGEYSAALGDYRDALALFEKRGDDSAASRALISVGNIQYLQADYDAATASYRRAESLAVSAQDPQGAAFARGGLARVLSAQGDLAAALEMYSRVLADARAAAAMDPRLGNGVATTFESIGEVQFRLGNMDQARAAFDEARRLVDADPGFSARLYSSLGITELVAGRFDAALADYLESRARFVKAKDDESAARAWIGIGFAQAARDKWDDAIAAYNSAIRDLEGHDEDRARAWLGLSLAQTGAGDQTAALESARKVTGIAGALKNQELAWRGAVRAGEALTKLARLTEARDAFQSAIEIIDQLALEAPVNPDARGQLNHSADAWAGLAVAKAKAGDARGALDAAEARRAHIRRMHLAAFHADITRGESDDERAAEQALVHDIVTLRAQVKAEGGLTHPDRARLQRLTERLTALTLKRAEQQAALYARLPALAEWRGIRPPAAGNSGGPGSPTGASTPDGIALDELVPDASTVAIEYVLTDDELLALVIYRGIDDAGAGADLGVQVTSSVLPLKRHGLADDVAAAMKPAVLQDPAAWRTAAEPLRRALLAPIGDRLEGRARCIFVPDDFIWKVPIEALPDGGGSNGALGTHMRVTYATSFETLATERRQAGPPPGASAVPLADAPPATSAATPVPPASAAASAASAAAPAASTAAPAASAAFAASPVISDATRAQLAMTQPGWKEPDPAASLARAAASAKAYGDAGSLKTGTDATKAVVDAMPGEADIVQVSAPFQVSGPTPLLSSILLAPGAGASPNELRWEAREWFALRGRAHVLVLDDASTLGTAGAGTAFDTLAWAAAAAGVSTVVLGRWPADAFALDALEVAFHAELAKGTAPAEAFQAAVSQAREKSAAPAAWAGLRLIGR